MIPDFATLGLGNATGLATAPLPIPALPWLADAHLYAQVVVLGSVRGSVSRALDINLK